MKRFILTPRARQDVNDIWDYIAGDNIEAALQVFGKSEPPASAESGWNPNP